MKDPLVERIEALPPEARAQVRAQVERLAARDVALPTPEEVADRYRRADRLAQERVAAILERAEQRAARR